MNEQDWNKIINYKTEWNRLLDDLEAGKIYPFNVSSELKGNKEFISMAIDRNPYNFSLADFNLRDDAELAHKAYSKDPNTIVYASQRIQKETLGRVATHDDKIAVASGLKPFGEHRKEPEAPGFKKGMSINEFLDTYTKRAEAHNLSVKLSGKDGKDYER